MDCERWDALRFRAKKNVYFCGAGMIKNYESQAFVLEMKYRVISESESDMEATMIEVDSSISPENEERMHWFDI